jgi:hypothetical protein
LTSAGAFGDPKSSGNKPSNEGHGFSRAVNSRLSFSSTQLENVLPFRRQPINRTNPIWFGQAPFKTINKLHRQKASCSANLDSLEVQPDLSKLVLKDAEASFKSDFSRP